MAAYQKRNGLRTIRNFAQNVCKYVTFWIPVICIAFPGNLALHAACEAANQARALLEAEADNVIGTELDA
jgi:hypothetical protein